MMSDITVNSLTSREVCLEQPGAILNVYPVIGLPCHKIENEAAGFSLMPGLESDEIQIIPASKLAPSFSELKQKLDRMKAEQPNVNGYGTADEESCFENKLPESGSSSMNPLKPDDTIPVEKKADESSANSVQVDSSSVVDKVNDCQVSSSLTLRPRRAKTNSQSDHDGSVTSVSSPKSRSRRSKVKGDTNERETDEKNEVPATLSSVLPKSEQILNVLPPAPSLPLENVGKEVKTTEVGDSLEKSATSPVPGSSPNLRPRRSKVQESKQELVQITLTALPESVPTSVEISLIEISPQVYSVGEANSTELIETYAKSCTSPIPGSSPNLRPRRAKVQESKQESIQVKKEKSENVKSEESFHNVIDSPVSNLDVNTNTSSDLTSTGFQVEESPQDLLTTTSSDQSNVSNEQFNQNSAVIKFEASAVVEKNALPADIADKSNVEPPLQSFCAETSTAIELRSEVEDSLNVSVMSGMSSPISGSSSFILSPEMKSKGAKTNDKLKMQLKRKKESMKHPLEASESCVQHELQSSEPLPSNEIQNGIVAEAAMSSTTADPVQSGDSEVPIKWKIGDMFWARVSGHPWWPCMVAPDPFESLYTRISKHNKFKVHRKRDYHMHYFGNEAERGWVCETSMIPYEGKEAFEKLISERIAQDKKNKALFEVKPSRMWARNIAIESAEVAYTLDHDTRIQRFMIIYEEPKPKSKKVKKDSPDEGTKGKRKAGSDAGGDVACMPKKKRKKMIESEQVIQIGDITFTELLNPDSLDEQDAMEDEEMLSETGKKINSNSESEHVGKRVRLRAHHKLGKRSGKDCVLNGGSEDGSDETRPSKTSTEDSDPDQDDDNIHYMISPKRPVKQVVVENVFEFHKLTNNSFLKKEDFCMKCEQPGGEFLHCSGPCRGTFHASCLGLTTDVPETFTCVGCTTGCHSCFVCKREDKDLVRCKVVLCGRFYHPDCVKDLKLASYKKNNLICPMHACATCASESESNPTNPRSTKGRLLKCIRCPKAYHVGDFCVPAGSLNICGLNILCSDHFTPDPKKKCQDRVNVSWCFVCAKGGTLVCCESCPSAFHVECLDDKPPLDGAWHCELCTNGKRPLYGEIIWIKIGIYRWWPGEVCHPRNVPTNIQNMSHNVGEFPVHFFGSNDYNWTNRSRVFSFQEGDKGAKNWCCTNNLAKYFRKGIEVATEAYKLLTELKAKKNQELQDKKPPYYKHVKSNVPIGRVEIYKGAISEIPRCHCRPDSDHPCGPDSDCINRLMMYECDSSVCPAGENCQNQRLQRHLDVDAMPFRTPSRGWGLKTKVDIEKGCFIAEYVGDLIDEVECQRRLDEAHERNISNFYMLTLDKNRIIDAGPKGNYSRFMNHSCQPNCETQKWNVNGDIRIGIFAIVDIPAGEELTFNYNLVCRGDKKTVCHCGAPVCSGFLGERPKSLPTDGEKKKKKRKKIRQPKQMIIHEDTCYRCGVGGELVLCDKTNCPKSYHLKCLKLLQIPRGKWICPWHLCDHEVCGKWATKLCVLCPNSFCSRHFQGNLFQLGESGDLVCSDHTSVLATADVVSISSSVPSTPMSTGLSCSSSETNSVSGVDGVYPYTSAATPSLLQSSKKQAAAKKDTKTGLGNSVDSRADSTLPNGVVLSDSLAEKIETKKPSIEENAGTASATPGRFSKRLRTSSTSTKDGGLSSAIERTNGELK